MSEVTKPVRQEPDSLPPGLAAIVADRDTWKARYEGLAAGVLNVIDQLPAEVKRKVLATSVLYLLEQVPQGTAGLPDEEVFDTNRRCRVCGCSDERACAGGCFWVPDPQQLGNLCSTCSPGEVGHA